MMIMIKHDSDNSDNNNTPSPPIKSFPTKSP